MVRMGAHHAGAGAALYRARSRFAWWRRIGQAAQRRWLLEANAGRGYSRSGPAPRFSAAAHFRTRHWDDGGLRLCGPLYERSARAGYGGSAITWAGTLLE